MTVRRISLLAMALATLLVLPMTAHAQTEAVITGVVTDSSGGVLPGVTVTAVHVASGNTFNSVTDERGVFRIQARVGAYTILMELQGFQSVRAQVTLLAGQTANIPVTMQPASLQENVTVTAEAPLVNVTQTSPTGNIDPQQFSELPAEGRNWMALLLVAPGSRTTSTNQNAPIPMRGVGGDQQFFQTNIDGQQVSNELGGGRQPLVSSEMISELQFISNRFDATQGRSLGVQVNVITKSGTNRYAGTVRGNFRDSRVGYAKDPLAGVVAPFRDQQVASSFGGPLIKDKLHFFGYQDYDHNPRTGIWTTPYPLFNISRAGLVTTKQGGLRFDYQMSNSTRFMVKGDLWRNWDDGLSGGSSYPSSAATTRETGNTLNFQVTKVMSNKMVNESKAGYSGYQYRNTCQTSWTNAWYKDKGPYGPVQECGPTITFTGFSFGGNQGYPRHRGQDRYWLRDDLSYSYDAKGHHDLRMGGEFIYHTEESANCTQCRGAYTATGRPAGLPTIPTPAQMQAWFPDPFNANTWDLNAINPWVTNFNIGIHKGRRDADRMNLAGGWVQDDWRLTNKVTLNLGMRWDIQTNAFANSGDVPPFMVPGRPNDWNNFAPRVGVAYALSDKTAIRGGGGLYYAENITSQVLYALEYRAVVRVDFPNDGRADFGVNPFNGPMPTYDQALARFCAYNNNAPNCLQRSTQELGPPRAYQNTQYTAQYTIGIQHQLATDVAFSVDYLYNHGGNEKSDILNVNLTYDPATGVNLPYSVRTNRPFPGDGIIGQDAYFGWSNLHSLNTSLTKRLSHHWQATVNYSLSGLWSASGNPLMGVPGQEPIQVPFKVADDLTYPYGFDAQDQRHRLVANGIWEIWKGFQISGYHYFGAGNRSATNYGGDLRNVGSGGQGRLRPDGTIVKLNSFIQPVQNRTNVRFQQRLPISKQVRVDVMAEAFDLFNVANYTLGTQESSLQYKKPVAGQSRTMQFGFLLAF
jgi:hypothetical protein